MPHSNNILTLFSTKQIVEVQDVHFDNGPKNKQHQCLALIVFEKCSLNEYIHNNLRMVIQ